MKMESWAAVGGGDLQGQVLWMLQGGRGLRIAGGEVVREGFLEEVGKGPQL